MWMADGHWSPTVPERVVAWHSGRIYVLYHDTAITTTVDAVTGAMLRKNVRNLVADTSGALLWNADGVLCAAGDTHNGGRALDMRYVARHFRYGVVATWDGPVLRFDGRCSDEPSAKVRVAVGVCAAVKLTLCGRACAPQQTSDKRC